ncbi:unnamed protein product [Trichobilharzia regenti]|nr:unnamed protein product [Trichobilharzia regenti]
MPTTGELNKDSVQLEREAELRADAVVEGMDTHETVSVNDQRVAHLSTDANVKLELIVKDSSSGNLAVRQPSNGRITTASNSPLSSSTCTTVVVGVVIHNDRSPQTETSCAMTMLVSVR